MNLTPSLLIVFVAAKAIALAGHEVPLSWWSPIAFGWHDAAAVLAFAAVEVFVGFARMGRPSYPREAQAPPLRFARSAVAVLYVVLALYVALNVPVTRVLSTPLTWSMWRAARGPLADSIVQYATWDNVLLTAGIIALAIGVPLLSSLGARGFSRANTPRGGPEEPVNESRETERARRPQSLFARILCGLCVLRVQASGLFTRSEGLRDAGFVLALIAVVALGPAAATRVDTRGLERNAWTTLAATAMPRILARQPGEGWRTTGFESMPDDARLARFRGAAAGRHIILVSLESTAAQYLGLYGAQPDVMPNLSALARHAIVFDHAYAVYPESIKALFSILCSAYPAFDSAAESYASAPCTPVASVLRNRGYRTALFHSGRFGYLGMESIVQHRGYDVLADAGDIGGQHNSSFGVDEPSTVARVLAWIDAVPAGDPFFVTYLPIAGHHPYDTPQPGPFSERDDINRYRNALHYGDSALGTLMRGVRARGLENKTLWVVFGDHGEAFGQHEGNYGHTFQIFEENVHVPLLIAAPGLFEDQVRSRQVVSLVDTAPTLLDMIGEPAPSTYQGRSMLDTSPRMALFFADYSMGLLGLRDGRFKMIYAVDSGRAKLFDLGRDPHETTDVSPQNRDRTAWYERNLRNWSAAQQQRLVAAR